MNDLSAMKREKNKTFRIKDIARLAGVSEGTVDRVLHDRGEVSEQTKEQVWDIIKKNGYQSNRLASRLASKKTFRIVAILPQITEDNSYWQQPLKGIDIAGKEFTGFGMNFETVNYDGACELDFEEKVSSVLNTLPDGIIFSPTFTESSRRMVALAQSQMVSYAFIDTNLPDCKSIGFFGQDAYMGGRTGARLVCNMIPDKSDVAIMLIGRQDNISHRLQDRAKGFISFVEEQAYKVFNLSTNKVDLNTAGELTRILSFLCAKENLKAIFVAGSRVHLVAEYFDKHNINDIVLVGFDLIGPNVEYLKAGRIQFLIGQRPSEQAYKASKALCEWLLWHKEQELWKWGPIDIVVKENLDYYLSEI